MATYKILLFLFSGVIFRVYMPCTAELGGWIQIESLGKFYYSISTSNVARCGKICLRQKACVAASFDIFERVCYLHDRRQPTAEASGRYVMQNMPQNTQEDSSCGNDELLVPSAHSKAGACVSMKSHIDDACHSNNNCVDDLAECRDGVCQCAAGSEFFAKNRQCQGCPIQKEYKLNSTLNLCFKIHEETRNWTDAVKACTDEEAHLMRFRNCDEWEVIHTEITASPDLYGKNRFWIDGVNDTGVWKNTDGEELWILWGPGEPSRDPLETRMNLLGISGRNYKMNDEYDDEVSAFICQYY